MSLFRNINLFWKFAIFGGLASFLLLVAITVSYISVKGTNDRFDSFTDKYSALALTVGEMHTQGIQTEQAIRNVILNPSDEKALSNYKKASEEFLVLQKEAVNIAKGVKEYGKQLDKLPPMWQENSTIKEEIIKLSKDGKQAEAVEMLVKKETPKWREIKTVVIEMQGALKKDMKAEHIALNDYTDRSFTLTMTILVIALVVVNILLIIFWKIMQTSFNEMVERLKDIASGNGDLTKRLEVKGKDEPAQTAYWLNQFIEKLHGIITNISLTSDQVSSAAKELSSTAEKIATGAEEVAAQAGTVATAGEEMSATAGDIAQNCQMAAEGAQRASQAASDGAAVVEKTVAVMGQIAEKVQESAKTVESLGARSDQIGAIIGTIEDIADQTNLLALNAAIEAARAGEQGRGFAVVADEVRALAERTTRATKEIGEMIKAIQKETKGAVAAMEQGVKQVETGTEEAAKSGQALQDILQQVNDVAMQVNQIATAAEEQTATTGEISSNMMQITEVVQQTSQGAHESAASAAQLNGNAEELQRLVKQFKL
ncbi:MAG: methyl-accepting chemotaxis protein [Deltaproteobacteria bacterium]|nr:methyl-accepting chemotaxis protein [Deltaproteobacteria bacterium]